MSTTYTSPQSLNFSLPLPKLRLAGGDQTELTKDIEHTSGSATYRLKKYPTITAMDLSQEQIDKGVYVEMLHYVPHLSPATYRTHSKHAGYIVPVGQIGGTNPLLGIGTGWTRGGSYTDLADRPNHYKVSNINEVLPVWEYLKNRHVLRSVNYNDAPTINSSSINLLIPTQRIRTAGVKATGTFGYSGQYRPYYFAFRYIMFDEKSNNWISGPLTRVVKLAHKIHPFSRNMTVTASQGMAYNDIDPLFNADEMACWFETRLPGNAGS